MWRYSVVILLMLSLISVGCGDSCENENPTVQLVNNGTETLVILVVASSWENK